MGKPREILRKAHALVEHGAAQNWAEIAGNDAAAFLDAFTIPDDDEDDVAAPIRRSVEDAWITE
jgi:DNA-binding ferritin-like protein (Dps family)